MSVFIIIAILMSNLFLFAVIKIVDQKTHISNEDLHSFSRLNPSEQNEGYIAEHIRKCERCRIQMNDLQHELSHLVED